MKNRKKLSAVTAFAVVAALVVPSVASASTTTVFTDISSSYAATAIQTLANEGILTGTGGTSFSPQANVTRQDMAIVLAKALNLDVSAPPATATFSDVPTTNYAFKYVEAAVKAGVIHGQGNGVFGYGQHLSRQDMAIMLVNALGVDYAGAASNLNFTDNSKISYGQDQVGYAVKAGLVHGMGDGTFNPAGLATREQVAAITANFLTAKAQGLSIKASASNVGIGTPAQFSVAGAANVEWSVSGNAVIDQSGNFVATQAGTYTVTAVANGKTLTQTVTVYGAPTAVTVSASAATLTATTGTTTLTAKVVDANGTPVAGATVDFYSSNTSILSVPVSATTDATGTATVTATAGSTDGSVTVSASVDGTALVNTTSVSVTPVSVGQVQVLNAGQIKVNFSEAVDTATAQTVANYSVADATAVAGGPSLPISTAVVQADGKSVILTMTAPIINKNVTVQATGVKSAVDSTTLPLYAQTVLVDDTTAPTVSTISSSTNGVAGGSVAVTFSEPVQHTATIKVDGVAYTLAAGDWTEDAVTGVTTATVKNLTLDPSASHTVDVLGVTDLAGNSATYLAQSFKVTVDQNAPSVSSVSAINDHQIEVTFSKAVTGVDATSVSLEDEGLKTLTNPVTVAADPNDSTGTKYIVSVPVTDNLYTSTGLSTRTFTLGFSNAIVDSLGNKLTATNKTVSLKEDTTAPVINGITYNTDTNGDVTNVVLHLSKGSEAIASPDATFAGLIGGIKVIDANGIDQTATFGLKQDATAIADGATTITLDLNAPTALTGNFKFMLPAGLVTDNSNDVNTSAATNLNVNFGSTVGSFVIDQTAISGTPASDIITVNFGTGADVTNSAVNPANYTLAGKALPADTVITLDSAKEVATITLPTGYVTSDDTAAIFKVANVQNGNGVTITPFTGYANVTDNTAPVLQSAQVLDANTILLTYSEDMNQALSTSDVASELSITNLDTAGNAYAATTVTANDVAGHKNQVLVTLGQALNLTQVVKVTTETGAVNLVDNSSNHNAMTSATTVTATR